MKGACMDAGQSQFRLLAERRFAPLFAVQFLGALNDNIFKQALIILLAYQTASFTSASSDLLQNLAQALFILPFFLLSAAAGALADRYDKSRLIQTIVALEVVCMGLGAWGLVAQSLPVLLAALFLAGVQSTLFGPAKYAILPQLLRKDELVAGNALVQTGTSVAILLGMIIGGSLVESGARGVWGVVFLTLTCSVAAAGIARWIPPAPAERSLACIGWNPATATWRFMQFMRRDRVLLLSILGISWFWFYGAALATQFPNLARNILGGSEHVVTLLLVFFSLGIGAGSLLCNRLSAGRIELGLVPFGSIGMSLFGLDLAMSAGRHAVAAGAVGPLAFLTDSGLTRIGLDLFLIGAFSGFYIVPLHALVQSRSDPARRARVIAANSILNAVFIVAAAVAAALLLSAGLTIPQFVLVVALVNTVMAVYIYSLIPEFLIRFVAWALIHSIYRLRASGVERIPATGPALLVCNHVSYVDALVISAACGRPIRWVMDHRVFDIPVLRLFFRTVKAIPIASGRENPQMLRTAYAAIERSLADGHLVGIFPEGRLTRTGEIGAFRNGITRILHESPVPVVPMALSGLWHSVFARNHDKLLHVARLFPRIRLRVGAPLAPSAVTPETLQWVVRELRGDLR